LPLAKERSHIEKAFDKDLFADSVKIEIGEAFDGLIEKKDFYLR